jgi:hypothetical protein
MWREGARVEAIVQSSEVIRAGDRSCAESVDVRSVSLIVELLDEEHVAQHENDVWNVCPVSSHTAFVTERKPFCIER